MSHGDGEVRASEQSYVVKWLNEEVRMSRSIHSLETQFANGYLVGELLHRQGVLTEAGLGRLEDSSRREARAFNFSVLEPVLRSLRPQVGPRGLTHLLRMIVTEQRGACAKLLFQIKIRTDGYAGSLEDVEVQTAAQQTALCLRLAEPVQSPRTFAERDHSVYHTLQNPSATRTEKVKEKEKRVVCLWVGEWKEWARVFVLSRNLAEQGVQCSEGGREGVFRERPCLGTNSVAGREGGRKVGGWESIQGGGQLLGLVR